METRYSDRGSDLCADTATNRLDSPRTRYGVHVLPMTTCLSLQFFLKLDCELNGKDPGPHRQKATAENTDKTLVKHPSIFGFTICLWFTRGEIRTFYLFMNWIPLVTFYSITIQLNL